MIEIYIKDCLEFSEKFTELLRHFQSGGFVAKLSSRYGSSLPYDQALEKYTIKLVNTRGKKEALLKYDSLKNNKRTIP